MRRHGRLDVSRAVHLPSYMQDLRQGGVQGRRVSVQRVGPRQRAAGVGVSRTDDHGCGVAGIGLARAGRIALGQQFHQLVPLRIGGLRAGGGRRRGVRSLGRTQQQIADDGQHDHAHRAHRDEHGRPDSGAVLEVSNLKVRRRRRLWRWSARAATGGHGCRRRMIRRRRGPSSRVCRAGRRNVAATWSEPGRPWRGCLREGATRGEAAIGAAARRGRGCRWDCEV